MSDPDYVPTNFQISSQASNGQFIGSGIFIPGSLPITVGAPVTQWVSTEVGPNTYQLRITYFTSIGVDDSNQVVASIFSENNEDWLITYQPSYGAFTVELASRPGYGWITLPGSNNVTIGKFQSGYNFLQPNQLFAITQVNPPF